MEKNTGAMGTIANAIKTDMHGQNVLPTTGYNSNAQYQTGVDYVANSINHQTGIPTTGLMNTGLPTTGYSGLPTTGLMNQGQGYSNVTNTGYSGIPTTGMMNTGIPTTGYSDIHSTGMMNTGIPTTGYSGIPTTGLQNQSGLAGAGLMSHGHHGHHHGQTGIPTTYPVDGTYGTSGMTTGGTVLPVANDLAANPGLPGVESYREGKGNLFVHKATNQTHFNEPILNHGGPGYTNGDIYDQPGYVGTQGHHMNPIDKIASVIVGQKYTHEPVLDRAYAEPNHMGPIDRLAHKLVGHTGAGPIPYDNLHATGNVLPTTTAMPMTTTHTKTEVIADGHHHGLLHKIKDKVLHHGEKDVVYDKGTTF